MNIKILILISLCLCLLASAISSEKTHKHQGKLLKSGPEEHKESNHELQAINKQEADVKSHPIANEQTAVAKPTGSGRKHRNNHHGKNKKGSKLDHNSETHTGRSRKTQTKPHKHKGQRSHNKHHGRKHGHGKQAQ